MDSQEKPEDKEIGIITFYGAQYGKIKEMYKDGKLTSHFLVELM